MTLYANKYIKYVPGDHGRQLLYGEFTGMTELWKVSPEVVVRPIGWGKLEDTEQDCYFLLTEFKNFVPQLADVRKLGASVANMHKKSQLTADTGGKFGFPIQTFDGARLQSVDWDSSWSSFFGKLLATAYQHDVDSNGIWPNLDKIYQRVQTELIPRLNWSLGTRRQESETDFTAWRYVGGKCWYRRGHWQSVDIRLRSLLRPSRDGVGNMASSKT